MCYYTRLLCYVLMQVREASQALLLAELRRMGPEGRRRLIANWAPSMPNLVDDANGSICLAEPEYELVTADTGAGLHGYLPT